MKTRFLSRRNNGFTLIEVIVGLSVISLALVGLIAAYQLYIRAALKNTTTIKATHLAEEGLEALRLVRDSGYAATLGTLTASTTYYLRFSTSTSAWTATTTPETIDGIFARSFVLYNVYRNVTDDIVASGTLDPDTKRAVVTVTAGTETRTLTTYLTNLFDN